MRSTESATALVDAVEQLRGSADHVHLPLDLPGVDQARQARRELVQQLDDYVLPRLRSLDAPLVCVVGGSTGSGKSTLVNSLVGAPVSAAGVLRPTTRSSVLIHHPDDESWFSDDRILPTLARVTGAPEASHDPHALRLVPTEDMQRGLALLDAPDIDSVVKANRELSRQLLGAADLWLFVTTAARYADAVPWGLLAQARERGTSVAIVLDRVPPEAVQEVRYHLSSMLQDNGLTDSPIFVLPETELSEHGLLPGSALERIDAWLAALAGDARTRGLVIGRTLEGALASLGARSNTVLDAAGDQQAAFSDLHDAVTSAYDDAHANVEAGIADGSLLRGEVLARWQELVGTGEFLRQVEATIGRARDRLTSFLRRQTPQTEPLGEALQSGAADLVTSQAELAAGAAARGWRTRPGGAALISEYPELARASEDIRSRSEQLVRQWQGAVLELVRAQAGRKRSTARYLAFGLNGAAVLLMLVVFSATGGLTGAEVGIAGGSAVLAQRLLEAVFGDQAVRELAAKARRDLLERVDELHAQERSRYEAVLHDVAPREEPVAQLASAVRQVEGAR